METEEPAAEDVFRVRVSLERFFKDSRARCYMGAARARPARWLVRRLRRAFQLPRALALLCRGHLLPPGEPLALLRPDDLVEVIPIQPSEQVHYKRKVTIEDVSSENIVSTPHIEDHPLNEIDKPYEEINGSHSTLDMNVSSEHIVTSVEPQATKVEAQASCVEPYASCVEPHASCVEPHASCVQLQATCEIDQTQVDPGSLSETNCISMEASELYEALPVQAEGLEASKQHALRLLCELAGEPLAPRRRRVRRRRRAPSDRPYCLETPAAESEVRRSPAGEGAGVLRAGSEPRAPRLVRALPALSVVTS